MKLAYVTADISHNGHFTFYHDLLTNYLPPYAGWKHKIILVQPVWDRKLVSILKEREIDVQGCFEDFHKTTDNWWNKIRDYTADCDVILSGNITNLDEVLADTIQIPIVSVSLAEQGYRSPSGGYGSFYKDRFHRAAVSKTAVQAFPEHVRDKVEVIYSGLDSCRLLQKIDRSKMRRSWFPGRSDKVKLILFMGRADQESKGLAKVVDCLEHLPEEYYLIIPTDIKDLRVPEHLHKRVLVCPPTYHVGDLYLACDCLVLPTEHEGLSMALLEAWYLGVPTVTTKHNTILELHDMYPGTDFGQLVDVKSNAEELAQAVQAAQKSESAQQCMFANFTAPNMVERWKQYLETKVVV